jgi:hypothetical protein
MPIIKLTKSRHIAYSRIDQLQIVVMTDQLGISGDDLREFINAATADYKARGPVKAFLTYSKTARLSPMQRKMIYDSLDALGKDFRANAIVTDSLLVRGMLTAFGWMLPGIKTDGFPPSKIAEALVWLEKHCAFDREDARRTVERMINLLAKLESK